MSGDDPDSEERESSDFEALLRSVARSHAREPPRTDELAGTTVGPYCVLSEIGRGGMGVVYLATDSRLERRVALKVLPSWAAADDARRRRFLREARTAAALNHPNIATVHDVGEADGHFFIAMEHIEGATLRATMATARLPASEVLRIAREITAGLAHAHERGVVHRDVKPENVMLTRDGRAKVLDFGLAKAVASGDNLSVLTMTVSHGVVMGTPGYMSPEQAAGGPVDQRSDVYALGVLLCEMETGERPARREVTVATNAGLGAIIARCLAGAPEDRWTDAGSVLAALERATETSRRSARQRIALAVGIAALVGVGALALVRKPAGGEAAARAPVADVAAHSPATLDGARSSFPVPSLVGSGGALHAPTANAAAGATYAAALQADHDGDPLEYEKNLRAAIAADPAMAAAHLRLAIKSIELSHVASYNSDADAHAEFLLAREHRQTLGEEETALLEAHEPWLRDPPDRLERAQRLARVADAWPNDPYPAVLLAQALQDLGRYNEADAAAERARAIDPAYEPAYAVEVYDARLAGDVARAKDLVATCLTEAPSTVTCLFMDMGDAIDEGRVADVKAVAQRILAIDPGYPDAYDYLAGAIFALGAPIESIAGMLRRGDAQAADPQKRRTSELSTDEELALLRGDLAGAADVLDERASLTRTIPSEHVSRVVSRALDLRLEMGDESGARSLVKQLAALIGASSTAAHDIQAEACLAYGRAHVGWATREQLRAELARTDRDRATDAARTGAVSGPNDPLLAWLDVYGYGARDAHDAVDALAALERMGGAPAHLERYERIAVTLGMVEALAGYHAKAIALLARIESSSLELWYELEFQRATYLLGLSRENTGDRIGARKDYARVLARWGSAKPRSATADLARAGLARLGGPGAK